MLIFINYVESQILWFAQNLKISDTLRTLPVGPNFRYYIYHNFFNRANLADLLEIHQVFKWIGTRLNAEKWDAANKEVALQTAFNSLKELNLNITFEDEAEGDLTLSSNYTSVEVAKILDCLQRAQCEQSLWELTHDLDTPSLSSLNLGGLLTVKLPNNQTPPPRYSPRALAILRPYLVGRAIRRTR